MIHIFLELVNMFQIFPYVSIKYCNIKISWIYTVEKKIRIAELTKISTLHYLVKWHVVDEKA